MHLRAPVDAISAKIAEMGFNCVRIGYALDTLYQNPIVKPERVTENPELVGRRVMEIMDRVIESLTQTNIMVVLNNVVSMLKCSKLVYILAMYLFNVLCRTVKQDGVVL